MAHGFDSSIANTKSRALANRTSLRLRGTMAIGGGLMLASMLDILMAILFFLLKNYSAVVSDISVGRDISLPESSAMVPPMPALQLVVTQKSILLDDKEVATIINGDVDPKQLWKDGVSIVPLLQAFKKQKDRSMFIQKSNDAHSFNGTIVMQADKSLQFGLLKKVIYTAGVSDFVMLKLAVLKKDDG